MVKLTGGYIGNDIAPKNIRYIAGGGSPNNKNIRVPTPEELRERQIKNFMISLGAKMSNSDKEKINICLTGVKWVNWKISTQIWSR